MNLPYLKASILLTWLLLAVGYGFAQSHKPITNPLLVIAIDEDGKLSPAPGGFAVVEGNQYSLSFSIAKPVKAQKALYAYLKAKLDKTYKLLSDPATKPSAAYLNLLGDQNKLDKLTGELKELSDILGDSDPESKFNGSSNTFEYFIGRPFLKKILFDEFLSVTYSIDGQSYTEVFPAKQTAVTTARALTAANTEISLTVKATDAQKRFLISYYQQALTLLQPVISKFKPEEYYADVAQIETLNKRMAAILPQVIASNDLYLCDEEVFKKYKALMPDLAANRMLKVVAADWLRYWSWLNEGVMSINPLPFTDEKTLKLNMAYDTVKADLHDRFVESNIQLLIKAQDLSAEKTSKALFDSLLAVRGKGYELYGHKKENDELKKSNKDNYKKFTAVNRAMDTLVLRVVPQGKQNTYFMKSYDAGSGKLKGGTDNDSPALPNEVTVELMAYNMAPDLDFSQTETSTPINDSNKAIGQLGEVGDLAGTLATQGTTAAGQFAKVIAGTENVSGNPAIPGFQINPGTSNITNIFAETSTVQSHQFFTIEGKFDTNNELMLTGKKSNSQHVETIHIGKRIRLFLADQHLDNCPGLLDAIKKAIRAKYPHLSKTFSKAQLDDPNDPMILHFQNDITAIMQTAVNAYADHKTAVLKNDLNHFDRLLQVAVLLSIKWDTLPPQKVDAGDDPGSYRYHNKYLAVADETTPKQKSLAMLLSNTTTKTTVDTKTELYKTSPGHWVTGSLGVAYIFKSFRRSAATVTNNVVTNTPDEQQFRLIAGLHFYIVPIVLTDDRFIGQLTTWREVASRLSIFAGVSFPQPFYNLHPGISVDLWPGIKLSGGLHLYRYTSYTILNNQILDQHSYYINNKAFISLNIEPVTFAKLLSIIK